MRQFKLCLVILSLLALLSPAGGAAAQVSQQMEIILDASGSMWGRVSGQPKITVAKDVLVELVESLADRKDLELGIRVYGHQSHRDKHDCLDSRLEIPFATPDPARCAPWWGASPPRATRPSPTAWARPRTTSRTRKPRRPSCSSPTAWNPATATPAPWPGSCSRPAWR